MEIDALPWPANLVDLLLDAVLLVDLEGHIVQISAAGERIFGFTSSEMIGRSIMDFVYSEDRAKTEDEAKFVIAGVPRVGFENRYVHKNGHLVHITWSALLSVADKVRIGVARDVTESKLARARQSALYAISVAVLGGSTDLATMFGEVARIVAEVIPTRGFSVFTAHPAAGQPGPAYQTPGSEFPLSAQQWAWCTPGAHFVRQTPESITPEFQIALPLMHGGRRLGLLLVSKGAAYSTEDIEFLTFISAQIAAAIERRMLHDDLLRAARYDELTGLPNRRLFYDCIRSALVRARRKRSMLALLYVDLDNFKRVNDTLGHAAGDAVLSQIAERLRDCVRAPDTVCRLGGDEFVVLIEDVQASTAANAVVEKIIASLDGEFVFKDATAVLGGASVGIALYPRDGDDVDVLLAHADREMYSAKRIRSQGNAGS